jgi:hypothetical protein
MMASTLADNVRRPAAPLSLNPSRNPLCLRARTPMIASAYSYRLASQHWLRAGRQHDLAACTARAFEHLVQDVLVASKVRYVVEPLSGTAPRPASAIGASRSFPCVPMKVA